MANPNVIIGDTSGMSTHGNELSAQPGSTSVADNVTFSRERLPERRNGFKDYSSNLPDFAPEQLLVGSNGSDKYLHLDNGLWYHDGSNWLRKRGNYGARQYAPYGVWAESGMLYIASAEHVIWKIDLATGLRTVVAGRYGASGTSDGTGGAARFSSPKGIWGDGAGNLYIADSGNHSIRKVVVSTGVVTTLAGTSGSSGTTDATGSSARFNGPNGIWGDGANLYVSDSNNFTVRKVVISSGVVTTFAGTAGAAGGTNATGSSARFTQPNGIWGDDAGSLYVCDSSFTFVLTGYTIRKVTYPGAVVTTLAGTSGSSGTADGTGSAARFAGPNGVTGDASGNLYVLDQNNRNLRKIVASTGVVSTIAGDGTLATVDGIGTAAQFSTPKHAHYYGGVLYSSETVALRKIYLEPNTYVTTIAGTSLDAAAVANPIVDGIVVGPD